MDFSLSGVGASGGLGVEERGDVTAVLKVSFSVLCANLTVATSLGSGLITPPPQDLTIKNVFKRCQMLLGRQNCPSVRLLL